MKHNTVSAAASRSLDQTNFIFMYMQAQLTILLIFLSRKLIISFTFQEVLIYFCHAIAAGIEPVAVSAVPTKGMSINHQTYVFLPSPLLLSNLSGVLSSLKTLC